MSRQFLTEQERIDSATLKIDDPTRIIGSGYIQFPPQIPFSQPIAHQPPTITGAQNPRSQLLEGEAKQSKQRYGSQIPQPRPSYPQQRFQHGQPKQADLPKGVAQGNAYPNALPQRNSRYSQVSSQGYGRQREEAYRAPPQSIQNTTAQPPRASQQAPGSAPSASQANGYTNGLPQASGNRNHPAHVQTRHVANASGLETAVAGLRLTDKGAATEAPLSKAQAKRLRKKLREGRADA